MDTQALKTRLEAIDAECEGAARPAIDKFYEEARYDGSRFCVPSFRAVGAVWLRLVAEKERRFITEIGGILGHSAAGLSRDGRATIQAFIDATFSEAKYLDRLVRFSEGVGRRAASYGVKFDAAMYRFDVADSAYRVGVMNAARKARSNVLAEIDLRSHPNAPNFVLSLSGWWQYVRAHPWKAIGALAVLGIAWLVSRIDLSVFINWLGVG